jgi:hypothetical protein
MECKEEKMDEGDGDKNKQSKKGKGARTKLNGEKDKRGAGKKEREEHKKLISEKVVKMSLNQALDEKKLIPIIEILVLSVSQLKVRSTLILNVLLLEACKTNIFPDFTDQTFWNQLLTVGTRQLDKPNALVEIIYNRYFKTFPAPKPIAGDTQIINYAKDELKTVFLNSVAFGLLDKQKYFIHDWLIKNGLETKGNVQPIQCKMNNWTCQTEPLEEASSIIEIHKQYLQKIGDVIWESGIRRKPVEALKYLYFLLCLREKENEECTSGDELKMFCIVPHFKIKRHFISIDTRALVAILKHEKMISKNCEPTNKLVWEGIFSTSKYKKNGAFSGIIETDGISCSIHYEQFKSDEQLQRMKDSNAFTALEKEMKVKKKEKTITQDELNFWQSQKQYWKEIQKCERDVAVKSLKSKCRVIAIDPGRCIIIYAVETINGKEITYVLTRSEYYNKSGMTQRNSRVRGWEEKELKEENLDVAQHSPKTTKLDKLLGYCNAIKHNWVSLWKSKSAKKRARESLRVYRLRLRTVDRFFQTFTATNKEKPVVAYGNAKFSPSGKNEKSVPTSWMHQRCAKHYQTIATDEFRSTQYHSVCHHRLSNVNVRKEYFNKKTDKQKLQIVSLRGLKWCSHCQKFVNRDGNGAKNIGDCLVTRPAIFCRQTPAEKLPPPVWGTGFACRF